MALLGGAFLPASAQSVVVDSLEFDKALATSPATLLEGQVAGVRISGIDGNINEPVNATIRGINALHGDSQPLWIIDGAIVTNSFNQNKDAFFQFGEDSYTAPLNALAYINEYDIEKVEVVKDLSAAAIYGAKGANGVILVTTKTPRKEGFFVNWRSNVSFSHNRINNRTLFPDVAQIDGFSHNHYIGLSGMKGQTKFSVNGYFRRTEGVLEGNNATYGGLRTSFDTKANSVVWFGMNAMVGLGKMSSIAGTSYFGQPSLTINMRNGGFFPIDTKEGWKSDYDDNMDDRRATASAYLTLNFTKSLSLKIDGGLDYSNNNRYIWYGNGTSFGFAQNGAASVMGTSIFKYNGKANLSWNRFFNNDHHVVVNAGADVYGNMDKFNTINGTDFFSHLLRARGISLAASKQINHKFDHSYFTWGFFANAAYDYKGIAGASLTFRADNTPRYDDKKLNMYKGVDAFFDIRKAFFSDSKAVSALKLKAGYGEAGKEQYVPYGMYGQYISGTYPAVDADLQMFYEGLNRVRSSEWHAGLELGFISDRINLGISYYDKSTADSFNAYCFGKYDGSYYWEYSDRTDAFSRTSRIANRGIEYDVKAVIFDNPNFKWTAYTNGAYNVNQMTEVDVADTYGRTVGKNLVVNATALGQPAGALYGYRTGADGEILDITGDGFINEYDKAIIGNTIPKFHGGIGTTFNFYGFTVDILGTGAFGHKILDLNSALFEGGEPFITTEYFISDKYVKSGDFFSLRRISLGYTFKFKKESFLKSLNINGSINNLFTASAYKGWDSDVNCFGTSILSNGIDYGSYPTPRSFVLGVSLNF